MPASAIMYAAVGPSDLGKRLKTYGSKIKSTFTGGGSDINSLLVVKKSAAALTRKKSTLSLLRGDERNGSGRVLSGSSEYSARL